MIHVLEFSVSPILKTEYDVVRRAAILADNPNHANVEDVRLMAQRILDLERLNSIKTAQRAGAAKPYVKG
jgi:hypothetical protein